MTRTYFLKELKVYGSTTDMDHLKAIIAILLMFLMILIVLHLNVDKK